EVLDLPTRRVRIEPGARWGEVAAALRPYGWALSSGDSGGVGVGGLATTGGIGFLGRAHGLTIDHVRAVQLVLADGSVVRASESENPDLFWGCAAPASPWGSSPRSSSRWTRWATSASASWSTTSPPTWPGSRSGGVG